MAERHSSRIAAAIVLGAFLAATVFPPSSVTAAPDCSDDLERAVEDGQSDIDLDPGCRYVVRSPLRIQGAGEQIRIQGNGATLRGEAASMFVVTERAGLALDAVTIVHNGGERAIVNHGYLRITVSTFSGASAGAIDTDHYARITESTFVGNGSSGDRGGAIVNRGELIVEDSTFSANESTSEGGAISNNGELTMRNATLLGNKAPMGASLENRGTAMLTNSIIAGWHGDTLCSGADPERVSPGNLTDRPDASCGKDFSLVDALRLGPLNDNGGLTETHALLEGSPAIDAGDNAECSGADQRGVERPGTNENRCDVGAFEVLRASPAPVNVRPSALDAERVLDQSASSIVVDLAELASDKETADEALVYELVGPGPTMGQGSVSGSVLTYVVDVVGAAGVDSITYRVTDRGAVDCGPAQECEGPKSATGTVTIAAPPFPLPVSPSPSLVTASPTPSPTASESPSPSPSPLVLGGPDLSIEDVSLELVSGGSAGGSEESRVYAAGTDAIVVAAGDSLHLTATVVNNGDEASTPTSMRVATSDWEGDPVPVNEVPPGSRLYVDESIDAPPGVSGDTKFTVTIDAVDGEVDGTNNARPDVLALGAGGSSTTKIVVVTLVVVAAVVAVGVALGPGNVLQRARRPRRPRRPSKGSEQAVVLGTAGVTALVDRYLGTEPGPALWTAGAMAGRLRDEVGEDDRSGSLIATLYWRSLMVTRGFRDLLEQAGASTAALERPEILVVPHASGTRHDLILLDPEFSLSEPSSAAVRVPSEQLLEAWEDVCSTAAIKRTSRVLGTRFSASMLSRVLKEVWGFAEFGVVVAPRPEVVLTHCPSPAWPVGAEDEEPTSTAGAGVMDGDGRIGVTVADHAVRGHEKVMVNGSLGTVISSDVISDSSFVEVDAVLGEDARGQKGPLSGLSPRQMEVAEFDGIRSGKTTTRIVGWDPTILTLESYIQTKIVTEPVTMPGDSGAALIDGEGHILGFAFYTTGLNSQPAHSGWIWAESVYRAHGLRPRREE